MRAINLLPRDDTRRKGQKPQWVVFVPVILAVLLSALLSMLFLSASGKVKDRKATLASLQAELAAIPTPDASKVQTQNALVADKQTRVRALNTALSRRVVWDRVFRELSLVRYPYKIYYEILEDEIRVLHIGHTRRRPWRRSS